MVCTKELENLKLASFSSLIDHPSAIHSPSCSIGDLHPGNVFVSRDGSKFILFDVGIATEYSESDHQSIIDILGSFIRRDGRRAGQLLIDRDRNHEILDADGFVSKMEELTQQAASKDRYLMQNLGVYISYICNAAAEHHIRMIPAFVSSALAVKLQEAIALSLDPSVAIIKVATPIIIECEARRRVEHSKRRFGFGSN